MTTASEIRKLAQPLLNRNPDLVLVGRFIFYKQVNHLLRGIYVDRCGDKLAFRPAWKISFLIELTRSNMLAGGLGATIYPAPEGHWYINNSNIDEKFADSMEDVTLPWLRTLETIENYSNLSLQQGFNTIRSDSSLIRKIYLDLALGRFESAENIFEIFSKHPDYWSKSFFKEGHFTELIDVVRPLVHANNKPAIAAKLHEWEAYSVKQLKLEKYWQPSPFPIESVLN